jgi:3D (Asp-Asp-Asp) domain-containing protein/predicted  nucleic acid-binding Zn-ribbon protein
VSGLKLAGAAGALVFVAAAAAAASPGDRTRTLRSQAVSLGAKAHSAELDLYALDSQLSAAQSQLASLEQQATELRAEQAQLSMQLGATRRTLAVSQQHLADDLRILYEQGDTDPLAVVLGAQSLDDAVTKLDDLQRVSDQSKRFVDDSTAARTRLTHLQSALAAHGARIEDAVRSTQATANRLAATRSDRLAFIARLRSAQRLKQQQIRLLETSARRAEAKSKALTAAAPRVETADVPAADVPTQIIGARTLTVVATGYSLPGHTATGLPVGWGVVAVDPSLIPLGTRLTIPGYGPAVAADVGSGVSGTMIDLWFPTLAQARAWGRRTVTITLH